LAGTKKTLVADVTGDGKADLILVDDAAARVAASTGLFTAGGAFGAPAGWLTVTGTLAGTKATLAAKIH
jgi:hypothetical protein